MINVVSFSGGRTSAYLLWLMEQKRRAGKDVHYVFMDNCGQKLHVLEVHVCEHCCAELMSDPNSSMHEEEDDG